MFEYKFRPEHRYYMVQQIWESLQDQSIYHRLSELEHEQIKAYVPAAKDVENVMDLGCGLGRAGVYLDQAVYQDKSIHYVMADSNGDVSINTGEFGKDEVYNNLNLTASFCVENGMTNFMTFDTKSDAWDALPVFDFITSRCSFGVHQPIEDIIDKLLARSAKDVTMIFGVRHHYNQGSFADKFNEVLFLQPGSPQGFPDQDWLILRGKK